MTVAAEMLRQKAHDYELSAAAAKERAETDLAITWSAISIVLNEVAAALELEEAA